MPPTHRSNPRRIRPILGVLAATCLGATSGPAAAAPLLPDLVPIADIAKQYMYGGTFDTTSDPGRVLYRFDAVLANLGEGPFEVFEITDANQTQTVYQEVYDSNGTSSPTLMGTFYNVAPAFGHLHLESLAQYHLRAVTPGNGVGAVVASHAKTSHAVVDSVAIDTSLPNAPALPVYNNVYINPLGISIGHADLYGRNIPTQRIDVTGIASGQYWLEVTIDPLGYVQETDNTNNTARILVDLTIPAGAATALGDYDNSGQVDQGDLDLVLQNWGNDVDVTGIPNIWINDRPSGLIEQAELDGVLNHWGATATPDFRGGDVPEPGLLGLGLVVGLACRGGRGYG